jgi:arylsulfatase A-like enzyme
VSRRMSPTVLLCLCLPLLVMGWAGCARGPRVDAVFLIVVDTLRSDRLSCYGYSLHDTPGIDELAQRGVLFTHAQSASSWTAPSMGAALTSLYPRQLGMVERPAAEGETFDWRETRRQIHYTPPVNETTIAEIFGEAGWHTAAFVNQPALNHKLGFSQGFVDWFYPTTVDSVIKHETGKPMGLQDWDGVAATAYPRDSLLVDTFEEWFAHQKGEQLFVWLHFLTPHSPYLPVERYRKRWLRKQEPVSLVEKSLAYDDEIRSVDALVGRVVRIIESNVGLENSLIVFMSDHGEEFGDHGKYGHGHSFHREVVEVPVILAGPSLPAGEVVDETVRTIDLLPTILDLVGEPERTPVTALGVSLIPLIRGDRDELPAFSEGVLYGGAQASLNDGRHKLMYEKQGERYHFFDVVKDPNEETDIAKEEPMTFARSRKTMSDFQDWLAQDYEHRSQGDSTLAGPEDEEVLKALRALGYIND